MTTLKKTANTNTACENNKILFESGKKHTHTERERDTNATRFHRINSFGGFIRQAMEMCRGIKERERESY